MALRRVLKPCDKILYFQGTKECDFVVQQNDQIVHLIQVTWDMRDKETRKREIDGIVEASRVTGCDSLIILTNNEEGEITEEGKTIKILPVWKWLLFQE